MADTSDLLAMEYVAINAHLRANITQFVNWVSFFLVFSFAALSVFVAISDRWPQPRLLGLGNAVPAMVLLLHVLAFSATLTVRHYIADADRRVGEIGRRLSPKRCAADDLRRRRGEVDGRPRSGTKGARHAAQITRKRPSTNLERPRAARRRRRK